MKKVKIYGNDGNTVYTDLDSNSNGNNPSKSGSFAFVTYGETSKNEMKKHIKNRDYLVCLYHMSGYNTAFLYPLVACINFSQPGTEMLEFTNDWVDGDIKHITYNVATDTWSAE